MNPLPYDRQRRNSLIAARTVVCSTLLEDDNEKNFFSPRAIALGRFTPMRHGTLCGDANAGTTIEAASGRGETAHAGPYGQRFFSFIQH